MRHIYALVLVLFFSSKGLSQVYGNTWINHSQQYFKFPIVNEGIYRIDSTVLSNYFNLATLNPKKLQLFIKGKEQFLYIKGENDNQINTNDYIEFFASPFMGDVDSLAYTNIKYTPNPYLPIFNDTLYGFITVNNLTTNKRFVLETDTNSAAYPASPYFYSEQKSSLYNYYNSVGEYFSESSDPRYTQAEGKGQRFDKGTTISKIFTGAKIYSNASKPAFLRVGFSGASLNLQTNAPDHLINISYVDASSANVTLRDTNFRGFAPINESYTISSLSLNNDPEFKITSVSAPSLATTGNITTLHYFYFFYPQTLDLSYTSNFKLFVDDESGSTKGFYNFSNFNTTGLNEAIFYDLTNGRKITTAVSGTNVRAVIPNGTGRKLCYLAKDNQVININKLTKVNSTGFFTNFKNLGGANPYIIIYNKITKLSSQQYSNYRQSLAGGSYNVIMADIDELYEQFCFGVNRHPLGIRHFLRFLNDSLPNKPRYVFLIGKGVRCDDIYAGTFNKNYIPTFGIPSSDNLLASELSNSPADSLVQEIPIGRLAATSDNDVFKYLTKVQQHESSAPAEWKKRVLHFVGGDDLQLTNSLSAFMSSYEQIIRDTLFGAEVYTYKKNTTAPIQINISDSIKNTISSGAALINFFGHGSEQGFDQAIDDPEQFNNTGKYPFMIANSCQSGGIHTTDRISVSERFVFADQKGSIGFVSTTALGFADALNNYSTYFYIALSKTKYNQGIGDIIKETCKNNRFHFQPTTRFTGPDMTLHGDPAIKISNGLLPDYEIKNTSVSFDTKKYTDSVGIKIKITNFGKAVVDSFAVKVERYFPNGDSTTIFKQVKAPFFKDSLNFYMVLDFNRGVGLNKFKVKIDEFNQVGESLENNNSTVGTVDVFIQGGDILPVYPYKYAVVPKTNTITLKASTTDPFAPLTTYKLELDTCDRFVQPIQSTLITSKGGVIEWNVSLPFADSTVYFWRVSHDSLSPTTPYVWRESSFQTVGTKRGWAQAHFHQFKNDAYQFVSYKKALRKFIFENSKQSIMCRNGIYPYLFWGNINWFFNNINMSNWGCAPNGWNFAVFDSITGQPDEVVSTNWPAAGLGQYKNCVCVENQVLRVYSFGANSYCGASDWKAEMVDFINAIPNGKYMLAYTMGDIYSGYSHITQYSKPIYTAFESFGAKTIRFTSDTVPYILFGKKGIGAGNGNEVVGLSKADIITLTDSITTRWSNGYIASEIIGPSFKWNSLHWRVQSLDAGPGDTTQLKILGIKQNGQIDTLFTLTQDSLDILSLGSYVNASTYPYMKLVAFMKDKINTSSPQLKRWQVLYDEAPECAINPLKGFKAINDTLQEGDKVSFVFPIENVGEKNFDDSLVITYWVEDNSRNKVIQPQKLKPKPFVPGQVILDTVTINTYQLSGNNSLWIFANPLGNGKYQREQHQFNNIGSYGFKVNRDLTNPLLDVTFDGIRILNGDIVSAKPNILITLKDENQFLELNDTSAFTIFIQAPGQAAQRIYFAQGLQFTPANLPKNSCAINYFPVFTTDGKYTLTVQAKDRSSNRSGFQNYEIQFEINNKPTITNILNYPNPFSTSTKFVFTLTGSEVPEVFTIQIMTITGKLVKEITRSELGNLHIGRNITEYTWDGRDNFGDKLANGVYLYKVVTKLNGENIEKSESGADKFFTKDFGKLVIMR